MNLHHLISHCVQEKYHREWEAFEYVSHLPHYYSTPIDPRPKRKHKSTAPSGQDNKQHTASATAVIYSWRGMGGQFSIHCALQNAIPKPAPQMEEKRKCSRVLTDTTGVFSQ